MQGSEAQGVEEAEQGQMRGVRPEKRKVRDTRQPPHTEGVRQDSYFLKSRPTDADNGVPGKPEETSKLGRLRWAASMCCRKGRHVRRWRQQGESCAGLVLDNGLTLGWALGTGPF